MDGVFEVEKWKKEIRRGVIEMCILSLLSTKEMYGYEISKMLTKLSDGILSVEEGTLYPLLRRLEEKRYIKGEWRFKEGKARKYYNILPLGLEVLNQMKAFWLKLVNAVDTILF
nr:PadR family transcriptional regulator [Candidatus Baldrarchaeota archaeon]